MSHNRFHAGNQQNFIKEAEELSQKLFSNQVPSSELHENIVQLDKLYMAILADDRRVLIGELIAARNAHQQSDKEPLFGILKRLLGYQHVDDEDNEVAVKIDSPESRHIQSYIKFLKACSDYANCIKKHMLRMRADLGVQSIAELNSITVDMDLNDVLDLHKDVMDKFAKDPAACYGKYYRSFLLIKFVNPVSPATMLFKTHLAVTGELYKSGHKVLSKSNLKMKY